MLTVINIGATSMTPDLAAVIERILDRSPVPAPAVSPQPQATVAPTAAAAQKGERYAGIAFSESGEPSHHLFLLDDKPAGKLTWRVAKDWAKDLGHSLPTRFESALLYANLRGQFATDEWYWTETQFSEAYAWLQGFSYGSQGSRGKGYEFLARAVRRLPL